MMVQVMDVDEQNSCVPAGHKEAVVRGEWAATCAIAPTIRVKRVAAFIRECWLRLRLAGK
jgi:hypothetical protein